MTGRARRAAAIALLTSAALAGCVDQAELDTSVAFSHDRCRNIDAGARIVSFSEAATLRGSQLLGAPPESIAGAESEPADAPPRLVAISKGPQPTPGYGFALAGPARLHEDTVHLRVDWLTPPADKPVAQVMTNPCIVVAIEEGNWRRIEVTETDGTPVALAERRLPTR
ncbi:MAG: protease complex subunit PrcB family protein [Pseudomonadota bacterium]